MSRLQNKALVDFKKLVSNCAQRGSWQPRSKARMFIIVNMPESELACIRGNDLGSESCIDYIENRLIIVSDDCSGVEVCDDCLSICKKTSFLLKLSKVGRLFDVKVDIMKDGRFVATAIGINNIHDKLAA